MQESFVDLLKSLTNDAEPVAGVRLAELSDLDAERLGKFASVWERLPSDRRQILLEELGLMADAQIELTFEPINRLGLNDLDSTVRLQAIENLWECEDPGLASKFLMRLEEDPAPEVRAAAGKALGVFILISETRKLDPGIQHEIEEGLLRGARNDSSGEVRDLCLQSLGYSSRPEVAGLIEQAYAAGSEARLAAALRAMAHSANPNWGENVMPRLHDPSPRIRLEAVGAAGEIDLREAIPDLIELLDDVDESVRRAVVWSLSQIGGPRATEALNSMTEGELDESQTELLRDAIDNLAFVEGARNLFTFEPDDPQDLTA
ncbi:MAG: HEAT repeat domain-containing protein [Anaerolineales bacterium]